MPLINIFVHGLNVTVNSEVSVQTVPFQGDILAWTVPIAVAYLGDIGSDKVNIFRLTWTCKLVIERVLIKKKNRNEN